jgi:uncharacterized protein
MLGKIIEIVDGKVCVKLEVNIYNMNNLSGKNVVFEDENTKIVGEVANVYSELIEVNLIGQIENNIFIYGDIIKPSFKSLCRVITKEELDIMFSNNKEENSILLGKSFIYNNYDIRLNVNNFFSNHFAVLGNTGSGKSHSVARIIQSIFYEAKYLPFRTNIFLFDAYGEYQQAFNQIGNINENINYKVYTTNLNTSEYEQLKIPFWFLGVDDIALLLNAEDQNQLPVIEKALKLVSLFAREEEYVIKQKDDIIARSLLDIIFCGKNPSFIRNKLVSVLTKFNTKNINLDINLTKGGWTRNLRQCIFIEESGKFADIEIVIQYLEEYVSDEFELKVPDGSFMYTLDDFNLALEFALISEGILNSDKIYDYANILKVRLNNLINSNYSKYFEYSNFVTKEDYIKILLTAPNGRKAQVINFNINYVDDRLAKNIVKIYSKLLFDYIAGLKNRASMPFHIVLEEAHRYVQNDKDKELLGYNIFERIAKEGRKYGILLGLISQRPSEISETTISQCSNFLIFKIFHPRDLEFIDSVLPNINSGITSKLKTLHPGTCIIYGNAFKMPVIVKMERPNPTPLSNNCDIENVWYIKK